MIEFAAQALCDVLPHSPQSSEAIRRQFNRAMSGLYAEVLDYVNLHYITSTRRDTPFWRAATAPAAISPTLADRLDLWRTKRPSELDFDRPSRLFSIESH